MWIIRSLSIFPFEIITDIAKEQYYKKVAVCLAPRLPVATYHTTRVHHKGDGPVSVCSQFIYQPSAPYPSVINHQHRIHQSPTPHHRIYQSHHLISTTYLQNSIIYHWAVQATRTAQCLIPQSMDIQKGGLETEGRLAIAWGWHKECRGSGEWVPKALRTKTF